jgi:hypothetical protein
VVRVAKHAKAVHAVKAKAVVKKAIVVHEKKQKVAVHAKKASAH